MYSTIGSSLPRAAASTNLSTAIARLSPVGLETLDKALLHDRVESKVVLRADAIPDVLDRLRNDYFVLEHDGDRLQGYRTEYFDSPCLRNYHEHHNQRRMRLKLRYRTYLNSSLTYFEIKRNVDSRTVKERIRSTPPVHKLWRTDAKFFADKTGWDPDQMVRSLTVEYQRVLLVKQDLSERVTIDLSMSFLAWGGTSTADALAICEFKQPTMDRRSPAMAAVKRRPQKFSKYCMGLASCDPQLKRNRFKKVFLSLNTLDAPILTQGAL